MFVIYSTWEFYALLPPSTKLFWEWFRHMLRIYSQAVLLLSPFVKVNFPWIHLVGHLLFSVRMPSVYLGALFQSFQSFQHLRNKRVPWILPGCSSRELINRKKVPKAQQCLIPLKSPWKFPLVSAYSCSLRASDLLLGVILVNRHHIVFSIFLSSSQATKNKFPPCRPSLPVQINLFKQTGESCWWFRPSNSVGLWIRVQVHPGHPPPTAMLLFGPNPYSSVLQMDCTLPKGNAREKKQ